MRLRRLRKRSRPGARVRLPSYRDVSFGGDGSNDVRGQVCIELDLLEAGLVIAVDDGRAFGPLFRRNMAKRFGPSGIDESGEQQAGLATRRFFSSVALSHQ